MRWFRKSPQPAEKSYHFRALTTFEAEINGRVNTYVKDLTYAARPGSDWDDLRAHLEPWVNEGKIVMKDPNALVRGSD